jgi:hypothetical protein
MRGSKRQNAHLALLARRIPAAAAALLLAVLASALVSGCGSSVGSSTTSSSPKTPAVLLSRRFTGHGNQHLNVVTVPKYGILDWHTEGPTIQVVSADGKVLLKSTTSNGTASPPPGVYRNLQVTTDGKWWFEVHFEQ